MKKEISELLRELPLFLTRAGWTYHPPTLDENGRFRYGFPEYDAFIEICRRFYDAGVRVFLSNLPVGWIDEDTYDFSSLDETLDRLFTALPDALYIPRLRLDPPFAWMEKYPEEICVFEGEATDPQIVKELVKRGNVNNTYDMTVDPRPNGLQPLRLDEPIGLQSFSSKKWLNDAEKALEAVIKHVMSGPYKDRFVGFHICFGGTCELLHWGNGGDRIGDFSLKHTEDFYNWAVAKYGSHESLCKAWQMPDLTRDGFTVPGAAARFKKSRSLAEFYRTDSDGCRVRDYELFHSESLTDAFLRLAKKAKELCPELAVGVFYGYEGYGHEHLDKLLSSDFVDYLTAPKLYDDPVPGGRGGSVAKIASIMSKKLWIEEIDNRPHTAWDPRKFASHVNVEPAKNLEESANVLWREMCKLEQEGASFWWMDQGDAKHRWYDSDELMKVIKDMVGVHKALYSSTPKDISEVFVISDTAANYYGGIRLFPEIRRRLLLSGVPFHEYRMRDIDSLDFSGCKLLIFTSPMLLTKDKFEQIRKRIPDSCAVLFTDLPGVCTGELSLKTACDMIGIEAYFDEEKAKISFADGGFLKRNGNVWLSIDPLRVLEAFDEIADSVGLTKYVKGRGVVHGNNLIFGVFATRDEGISGCRLPERGDWYEWFSEKLYADTDSAELDLLPKGAAVFIKRELWEKT